MSIQVPSTAEKDLGVVIRCLQQLAQGRTNATGTVTLTDSAATTTVKAPTCGVGSIILLMPQTAHASAEAGAGTIYIQSADVTAGQFIITHANNAQTDRTFGYVVFG